MAVFLWAVFAYFALHAVLSAIVIIGANEKKPGWRLYRLANISFEVVMAYAAWSLMPGGA